MTQADKKRFRQTKKWKDFRERKRKEQGKDPVTNSKLIRGYNLHHLDMSPENYTDITNEENFVGLNPQTHDMIHFLYGQGGDSWKDKLLAIAQILRRMDELNQ